MDASRISSELGISGFITCQDQYSMLARAIEKELIPAIEKCNSVCCRFSRWPAACLRASIGEMWLGRRDEVRVMERSCKALQYGDELEHHRKARKFRSERNYSMLELAFGWLLAKPVVARRNCGRHQTGAAGGKHRGRRLRHSSRRSCDNRPADNLRAFPVRGKSGCICFRRDILGSP